MSAPTALLLPREVAAFLRVSKKTIYRRAESGELPAVRVGRELRFSPRDIPGYEAVRDGKSLPLVSR